MRAGSLYLAESDLQIAAQIGGLAGGEVREA